MNKIIYTVAAIFSILVTSGCTDFLDKKVLANATDKTYYNTQYKIKGGKTKSVNTIFDKMRVD